MAEIVAGIGTSHSPILVIKPPIWMDRIADEMRSKDLYDTDGAMLSYEQLRQRHGEPWAANVNLAVFDAYYQRAQRALDHLAADLAEIDPDVVIVVGDDQEELFGFSNLPSVSIFYGDKVTAEHRLPESAPLWLRETAVGYGMDGHREYPAAPELAQALIASMLDQGIDVAISNGVPRGTRRGGFGHAFTFPAARLMPHRQIPIIPVLLNTYYPPNQPTPSRCVDVGKALRHAVQACPLNLKVMVLASGGLSHFVTDERLDTMVLDALRDGDEQALRELPTHLLNSGNSEIRNWIVMGGALQGLGFKMQWHEYIPVYRTAAGTGIGLAFGRWT
jgi:hypothetical protein